MTRAGVAAATVLVLLAGLGAAYAVRRPRAWSGPPPTPARIAALVAERDQLESRLHDTLIEHGETSLDQAPNAGVMIGIPTAFTASVVDQVVTGLFGETTITLRDVQAHARGDVKANLLFTKTTLGHFDLSVKIHTVSGVLRPERPNLTFGDGGVTVALPVHLASGSGDATLHLKWNSEGAIANTVCGDVDVTRKVGGRVLPHDYLVKGRFLVAAQGESVVLRPEFPDLAVRIFVVPSDETWAVVDKIVRDRPQGCEIALHEVDLKRKLGAVLGKGFKVTVPQKILRPVTLPAGVQQSLEIQGVTLALDVTPAGLLVASDRIWYGADLSVHVNRSASR